MTRQTTLGALYMALSIAVVTGGLLLAKFAADYVRSI